jgi:Transposase DDE domain
MFSSASAPFVVEVCFGREASQEFNKSSSAVRSFAMDGSATPGPLRPLDLAVSGEHVERAFQLELLARLPLAQAMLLLFAYVLDVTFLQGLFARYRGRCYTRKLTFAVMVYLIRDALLIHRGSGRASFLEPMAGPLGASLRAVYRKLGRMPLALSMALLRESTPRLLGVMPAGGRSLPPSLAGLRCIIVDGKTLKHVTHRLGLLRPRRGRVISGKMLAALEWNRGLVLATECSRNAEANDCSLVDGLLEQLGPAGLGEVRLFVDDRQFCDLPRLAAFSAGGHHYLIRHNRNIFFHPDSSRPQSQGTDSRGLTWVQEWGWLGAANHPQRRYVRRITLLRPTETQDVAVVTDLLDEKAFPAEDLLEVYRQRWQIEQVFQQLTEVFDLKTLIGGDPKATLFQAAFCCVSYNLLQVVRAHVAAGAQKQVQEVSCEKLLITCQDQMKGWAEVGDPQVAIAVFNTPLDTPRVQQWLVGLLARLWRPIWQKTPKQKKHGKTKTTIYPKKGYSNVGQLQDAAARVPAAKTHPARQRR